MQADEIQSLGKYGEVTVRNMRFILDRSELHDYQMLLQLQKGEVYEPEVTYYISQELKAGHTFVDIGANNGYYTILASQLVSATGKVLSFEPNHKVFDRLLNNIQVNGLKNVACFNFALADFDGQANLYLDEKMEDGQASLKDVQQKNPVSKVIVKKSGDFFKDKGLINMIKMDVEGSEISILKGMEGYIYDNKDIKIIMEWNASYRTFDDYSYLGNKFNIFLLLWESNTLQKHKIKKYYEIPGLSNLLLTPKRLEWPLNI